MNLQKQIHLDLKHAMLNKQEDVKSLLRVLIGELNREGKELDDIRVIANVKKMIENAKTINNLDEIKILEKYLPQQLDEIALKTIIAKIIADKSYSSIKDMGKVMGDLKNSYAGQYDGQLASKVVKETFNQ